MPKIVKTILLFLQLWYMFYDVSAAALNHLIQFLNYMFVAISEKFLLLAGLASVLENVCLWMKMILKSLLFVKNVILCMHLRTA